MTYCTYITFHPSGLFYIGKSEVERIRRGYTGSGVRLRVAYTHPDYDKSTWTTEVLDTFETEAEAFDAEAGLVTYDTLRDPLCLNTTLGGRRSMRGSPYSRILKQDARKRKSK